MFEQIRCLVKLQAVDKTLFSLIQEQKNLPLRLAEASLEQDRIAQALEIAKIELKQLISHRCELEASVETVRLRLRKVENRLMESKNQREYEAATTEVKDAHDGLKNNEDLLLEIMERQETLQHQIKGINEEYATANNYLEEQRHKLSQRVQDVDRLVKELNNERYRLAKAVEAPLLKEYDFLLKRKQGIALAPVSNGTCLTCHMDIPPQQFNELQRLDKIIVCQSCKRLLYWADAEALADLR